MVYRIPSTNRYRPDIDLEVLEMPVRMEGWILGSSLSFTEFTRRMTFWPDLN